MAPRTFVTVIAVLLVPASALAQAPQAGAGHDDSTLHADHAHSEHAVGHHAAAGAPSAAALEQIETVRRAVEELATPQAARAAGFRPALGMIPTMGTHWVSLERMRTGTGSDLVRPEHLMFSPIGGEQRLVGVAFAYQATPGQPTPDLFDGELDAWHTHPELSPPGRELTMLHVWFVPSPDGPFAGHNPWLAYWAVGLEPPDPARLADASDAYRIRALGLALAETVDEGRRDGLLARLAQAAGPDVEARRERIRTLVPALRSAAEAGDIEAWNSAADAAVAEWEEIRAASLAAVPFPLVRARLADFYEEMLTGGHGVH